MSNFSKLLMTVIIFMVIFFGTAMLGTFGHMIKAGKISGKTLAIGTILFLIVLAALIIAAASALIMHHSYELKKPKAGEILSDIIRIGELEKQREAEKAAAKDQEPSADTAPGILPEIPKSEHSVL